MNLCEALLEDYLYCEKKGEYTLGQNGWFEKGNMNEKINCIRNAVIKGIQSLNKQRKGLAEGCVFIDSVGLSDVLLRYSRDIFGQRRLEFQIESLTNNDLERRESIKKDLNQFGCRASSSDPFFYRKIGYLFYWFSLIKPFHLDITKVDITRIKNEMKFYFNEFTTYTLLKNVVDRYKEDNIKYKLTIHEDPLFFRHFLYDLHYRDLSRSSLEFFLRQFVVPV